MDKKKIILVSLGHLSCDVNAGALPAALPYARDACHIDYQAAGGLIFAYSCLSSLIQPLLGLLADKHNKPWFVPLGVLLAGAGLACMGFFTNYWAIFAGITISGIGSAFFHPEAARFANRVSGKSKGAGLSIFAIGGNGGFILGPLLASAFIGCLGLAGMGLFGIIALIMAAILYFQISRLPVQKDTDLLFDKKNNGQDQHGTEDGNNWREFSKLMAVITSRSITFTGCNTFIPLYFVNAFGQSEAAGAMALVIFGAFGVIFNIAGGFFSDRWGCIPMIRIAFLLMTPMVLVFGLIYNTILAYAFLPLLSLALYLPYSAQVVLGQNLLAKNMGFASGVTLGLSTSIGGIAQPLLGWIADGYGLHAIFICLGCVGAIGFIASILLNKNGNTQ